MEMTDRPHHHHHHRATSNSNASATTGGELFICFTSRLSSSMKLPSKSILSPARQPDSSSSSSLTRRPSLRNGQASPMFPPTTSNTKKRGCAGGFDNPEPTSPKVTCIGQVRVKTKAKKILLPNRSNKPTSTQLSFRKIDPNNNLDITAPAHLHHQECRKWVHFPVTICEALRAIGTEFNCFLPCRSSCMPNHNKQDKASSDAGGSGSGGNAGGETGSGSSCGAAVLARWLVAAVQQQEEGERRGGRQIELVVGDEEEEDIIRNSHRRHVFEDIEINLCEKEKEKEQGSGVSICIPPKNALLLMRCRSDPLKMAALANRSWEPSLPNPQHRVMEEEEEEEEDHKAAAAYLRKQEPEIEQRECSKELSSSCEKLVAVEQQQNLDQKEVEPESSLDKEQDEDFLQGLEDPRLEETTAHESSAESGQHDVEILAAAQGIDDTAHESPEESPLQFVEAAEECKAIVSGSEQEENGFYKVEAEQTTAAEPESEPEPETVSAQHFDDTNYSEETRSEQEFVEGLNEEASNEETEKTDENGGPEPPDPEENGSKQEEKLLPDCLLLMMCEPKLSMEVSKETWVCSRDFIRWQPQQKQRAVKVKRKDGDPDEDDSKRRIRKPVLLQPPRSSCSFPVAPPRGSVARMIDGGGKGCEPFVLTRCKSEPMRSAANLAADSCSWKNRKLEPATVGVGAAGVGF